MRVQDQHLAEVVVSYADTVIDVVHVREQGRSYLLECLDRMWDPRTLAAHRYVIGEGPQTHLTTTGEALSDPDGFAIVRAEAGGFWLDFTTSMHGTLREDGCTRSFAQLIRAELATPQGGCFCVLLRPGAEARIDRGRLQFHVRVVAHEAVRATRWTFDKRFFAFASASACFGFALLALMRSIPPEALALDQALLHEPARTYQLAMQLETPRQPSLTSEVVNHVEAWWQDAGAGVHDPGQRGENETSEAPRRRKPASQLQPRERRPRELVAPRDTRELGRSSTSALLELVGPQVQRFAAASPAAYANGVDDHELWRAMTRSDEPDLYLVAGLGLAGSGRGRGESLHSRGNGWDGDGHRGIGCTPACQRERERKRYERVLTLHIGDARVDGELELYAVRRVVRAHEDELVACLADADLEKKDSTGELTVNFAIAPSGAVATAVINHSTFDDPSVARCVTRAIERWRFSPPKAGEIVFVTHDFEFGWTKRARER